MDAKQYLLMPFKKAFDFKSKTNRKDFWLGIVFLAIAVFSDLSLSMLFYNELHFSDSNFTFYVFELSALYLYVYIYIRSSLA